MSRRVYPPRCVAISFTTRRGGSTPLDVSLFPLRHVEEGLPPSTCCYFLYDTSRRVYPPRVAISITTRRGGSTPLVSLFPLRHVEEGLPPSTCCYFHYDTLRRVFPPRRVAISFTTRRGGSTTPRPTTPRPTTTPLPHVFGHPLSCTTARHFPPSLRGQPVVPPI